MRGGLPERGRSPGVRDPTLNSVQSRCPAMSKDLFHSLKVLLALSNLTLDISRRRAAGASLGNPGQSLTISTGTGIPFQYTSSHPLSAGSPLFCHSRPLSKTTVRPSTLNHDRFGVSPASLTDFLLMWGYFPTKLCSVLPLPGSAGEELWPPGSGKDE